MISDFFKDLNPFFIFIYFMSIFSAIDEGIMSICRPPRSEYSLSDLPESLQIQNYGVIKRIPVSFKNPRNLTIIGSYYAPNEPIENPSCVIYLHGNASSQLEGTFLIPVFVPFGVSVLCIDTSGSGRSEGEFISLGLFEKDDVFSAISYLHEKFNVKKVGLYGRSMGAAIDFFCLAEADKVKDVQIVGAVADSPFSSLEALIRELSGDFLIPRLLRTPAVWIVASKIKKIANFSVYDVSPISMAPKCKAPIFIIHGEYDSFIHPNHSKLLYDAYGGENKKLVFVSGDHNSERPYEVEIQAIHFLADLFGVEIKDEELPNLLGSAQFHFGSVEQMMEKLL